MNLARLCCCAGSEPVLCNSTGSCIARLGYSSLVFSTSISFSWGFFSDCVNCIGGYWADCEYAIDGAADVGDLVIGQISPACTLGRQIPIPSLNGPAWEPPTYGPCEDTPCEVEPPWYVTVVGPWYSVTVRCVNVRGVGYGEARITLWRNNCSGFDVQFGNLYYRRLLASDGTLALGEYAFHHHDMDETWFDCGSNACAPRVPMIRNLDPGSVVLS